MPLVYDILTEDSGELRFAGDDIAIGESTVYHKRDLIVANKGEYKQWPLIGVGLAEFLLDNDTDEMLREVRRQMKLDGIKDVRVKFTNNNMQVDGEYP